MRIAIVLYDGMTALDAVGPYEVLSRLPGATVEFVAVQGAGLIRTDAGFLGLQATTDLDGAARPDLVLVPGGPVPPTEGPILDWLRSVDRHTTWTTSVCTGSVTLAAAGLLTGRRATTHWLATPMLAALGATVTTDRVVVDGKYATAAGVSAGIDLALTLAAEIAGPAHAQLIQLGIEYAPEPPFTAGSPATAPPELVAHLRANPGLILGGDLWRRSHS
jgi:transcriptional regulator GlxA family with amidase domain